MYITHEEHNVNNLPKSKQSDTKYKTTNPELTRYQKIIEWCES